MLGTILGSVDSSVDKTNKSLLFDSLNSPGEKWLISGQHNNFIIFLEYGMSSGAKFKQVTEMIVITPIFSKRGEQKC